MCCQTRKLSFQALQNKFDRNPFKRPIFWTIYNIGLTITLQRKNTCDGSYLSRQTLLQLQTFRETGMRIRKIYSNTNMRDLMLYGGARPSRVSLVSSVSSCRAVEVWLSMQEADIFPPARCQHCLASSKEGSSPIRRAISATTAP